MNDIKYENNDLENRELLKQKVAELARKMHNYAHYQIKEYKFNENIELDVSMPHIFIDVDMIQPETFTISATIIDLQDFFTRELDGDMADQYEGENRRVMPFLTQNLNLLIEKYLNSKAVVALLRECQSFSTDELYGVTLYYDVAIKG